MNRTVHNKANKRLLLICDYRPELLDSFFETFNCIDSVERILIRKKNDAEWRNGLTRVIDLPLRVFGEEDAPRIASAVSVLAYLVMATVVGILVVIKRRLDAVVGIFAFPQGLVTILVAELTRRKAAVFTDGGDLDVLMNNPLIRAIILISLRRASIVTALNMTKANQLLSFGLKVETCPTIGINTSRFKYVRPTEKDENSVLFAGRLTGEKCPELLLKACKRLSQEGIRLKVLIAGDGPLRDQVIQSIRMMNMADTAIVMGFVAHSEMDRIFGNSAIFVLPSVREGVSISLLEAMSSGCLCIASDIPDNTETIQHMYNGIIFRVNDEEDLANKLRLAICASSKTAAMTVNARHLVVKEYSLHAVANTLSRLLSKL